MTIRIQEHVLEGKVSKIAGSAPFDISGLYCRGGQVVVATREVDDAKLVARRMVIVEPGEPVSDDWGIVGHCELPDGRVFHVFEDY